MKQHLYRITVEHLADKDGQAPASPASLQFECGNHDDILALVERSRGRLDFDPDTAAALILVVAAGLEQNQAVAAEHPLLPVAAAHRIGVIVLDVLGHAGSTRQSKGEQCRKPGRQCPIPSPCSHRALDHPVWKED